VLINNPEISLSDITNNHDVSLALAVWLVNDQYDHIDDEKYISATALMKPLRQIILGSRLNTGPGAAPSDVVDFVARAMGNSLHTAIETAWLNNHERCMSLLGYPRSVIDRVLINPKDEDIVPGSIPIYLEQRAIRELMGYKIGGKFDMVADGVLQDYKSTSTKKWVDHSGDSDYCIQGSIYRWLNPDKIKEDFIRINFIFTDWNKRESLMNSEYPKHKVAYRDIPLMSSRETEQWIATKLNQINKYQGVPESEIPYCTDEELWRSEPQYKYYSDPSKTARSTKNFDTMREAHMFMGERGKGIVITVPGLARRCDYCNVSTICTQRSKQ
jgi:hypothetical protein